MLKCFCNNNDLFNKENDILKICNLFPNLKSEIYNNCSKLDIINSLNNINEFTIIYFSGHVKNIFDSKKQNGIKGQFITNEKDEKYNVYDEDDFYNQLNNLNSNINLIIIFDTCMSNLFSRFTFTPKFKYIFYASSLHYQFSYDYKYLNSSIFTFYFCKSFYKYKHSIPDHIHYINSKYRRFKLKISSIYSSNIQHTNISIFFNNII
jgi:hypothetical protein